MDISLLLLSLGEVEGAEEGGGEAEVGGEGREGAGWVVGGGEGVMRRRAIM